MEGAEWKVRTRAPRLINFLWILYYLRRYSYPYISAPASALWPVHTFLSQHPPWCCSDVARKVRSNFPLSMWRAKAKMRGIWSSPSAYYHIYLALDDELKRDADFIHEHVHLNTAQNATRHDTTWHHVLSSRPSSLCAATSCRYTIC